jgi:hypothetical protein
MVRSLRTKGRIARQCALPWISFVRVAESIKRAVRDQPHFGG